MCPDGDPAAFSFLKNAVKPLKYRIFAVPIKKGVRVFRNE